jgi:hypothetical protein
MTDEYKPIEFEKSTGFGELIVVIVTVCIFGILCYLVYDFKKETIYYLEKQNDKLEKIQQNTGYSPMLHCIVYGKNKDKYKVIETDNKGRIKINDNTTNK